MPTSRKSRKPAKVASPDEVVCAVVVEPAAKTAARAPRKAGERQADCQAAWDAHYRRLCVRGR